MVTTFETIAGFAALALILIVGLIWAYHAENKSRRTVKTTDRGHASSGWKQQTATVRVVRRQPQARKAQAA